MIKGKQRMRIHVLFSIMIVSVFMLISGCKDSSYVSPATTDPKDLESGKIRRITVTVAPAAGANLTLNKSPAVFQAEEGSAWYELKAQATSLVTPNSGHRLKDWWLDSTHTTSLGDNYQFANNVTVYAQTEALPTDPSKLVTITVHASSHITVNGSATITGIKQGETGATTWGSIKAQAEAKLSFDTGYTLDGWKKGSISGSTLNDGDTFANNTDVYAVAKPIAVPPSPGTPNEKKYTANTVEFTMKKIADSPFGVYYIGETEVTQKLWHKVMGSNPSHYQGHAYLPDAGEKQRERPVEKVTWYDCIVFCNKLTTASGLGAAECVYYADGFYTTVYTATHAAAKAQLHVKDSAKGFRLPKEAEWEWAARDGTKNKKWAGTNDEDELPEYAWYSMSSGNKTHEVKKKNANEYGLYDMSGNVTEWCWNTVGVQRAMRGGSCVQGSADAACAFQYSQSPDGANYYNGVRVACKP